MWQAQVLDQKVLTCATVPVHPNVVRGPLYRGTSLRGDSHQVHRWAGLTTAAAKSKQVDLFGIV